MLLGCLYLFIIVIVDDVVDTSYIRRKPVLVLNHEQGGFFCVKVIFAQHYTFEKFTIAYKRIVFNFVVILLLHNIFSSGFDFT